MNRVKHFPLLSLPVFVVAVAAYVAWPQASGILSKAWNGDGIETSRGSTAAQIDSPRLELQSQQRSDLLSSKQSKTTSQVANVVSLPPAGASVSDNFEHLRRLAEQGSPHAACRLATDLQQCAEATYALSAASTIANAQFTSSSSDRKVILDRILQSQERSRQMCAGVGEAMLEEAYHFQSMAADRGGEAMRRQLVLRPALDRRDFLSDLDGWTDYRSRAAEYVDELLRRRNVNDMALLLSIYAPGDVQMPRPPYRRKDDLTFLALIGVAKRNSLVLPAYIATAADNLVREHVDVTSRGVTARAAELGSGWSAGAAMIDPALAMSPKFAAEACQ